MKPAISVSFLGLVLATCAYGATLRPGDVIVGSKGDPDEISVLDPNTGAKTLICRCAVFNTLRDLAVSGSGKIYGIGGLVLPEGGFADGIAEIDPVDGSQRIVSTGGLFGDLQGIAIEADGHILVSDDQCAGCGASGGVLRIEPSSGAQAILASGEPMIAPRGIDVCQEGIYLATQLTVLPEVPSGVLRIDPETGVQQVVAYGYEPGVDPIDKVQILGANDVAVDRDGTVYVMDVRYRGGSLEDEIRLLRVDPGSGQQTLLTKSIVGLDRDEASFTYLGMDVLDSVMFVVAYRISESGLAGVVRFDPAVGFPRELSSDDFYRPSGLSIVPGPAPARTGSEPWGINILAGLGVCGALLLRRRRHPWLRDSRRAGLPGGSVLASPRVACSA